MFLVLIVVAGNETTRNALTGGLVAFSQFPDQKQRVIDDPSLWDTAVDEVIRFVSPVLIVLPHRHRRTTPTRASTSRPATRCSCSTSRPTATRRCSTTPTCSRSTATRTRTSAFGIGTHYCLGANLARAEVRVVFEELFRRLGDIRVPDGAVPQRGDSSLVLSLEHLPAVFTPEVA